MKRVVTLLVSLFKLLAYSVVFYIGLSALLLGPLFFRMIPTSSQWKYRGIVADWKDRPNCAFLPTEIPRGPDIQNVGFFYQRGYMDAGPYLALRLRCSRSYCEKILDELKKSGRIHLERDKTYPGISWIYYPKFTWRFSPDHPRVHWDEFPSSFEIYLFRTDLEALKKYGTGYVGFTAVSLDLNEVLYCFTQ